MNHSSQKGPLDPQVARLDVQSAIAALREHSGSPAYKAVVRWLDAVSIAQTMAAVSMHGDVSAEMIKIKKVVALREALVTDSATKIGVE